MDRDAITIGLEFECKWVLIQHLLHPVAFPAAPIRKTAAECRDGVAESNCQLHRRDGTDNREHSLAFATRTFRPMCKLLLRLHRRRKITAERLVSNIHGIER